MAEKKEIKKKTASKKTQPNKVKQETTKKQPTKKQIPTKKHQVKEQVKKSQKTTSEKVLLITFLILLIVVLILGIKVFDLKNKNTNKIKANLVIPILEEKSMNEFSIDISKLKLGEVKEYIFKINNYKDKLVNSKELDYTIRVTKPASVDLKLYKDDNNTNLFSPEKTTEEFAVKLPKENKKSDLYRLIIKVNKKVSKNERVFIKIES